MEYQYQIGQDIGLMDTVNPEDVEWYKLLAMEQDDELPIGWFYLVSEVDSLNNKFHPMYGNYAELIDSISDRIVVKDK